MEFQDYIKEFKEVSSDYGRLFSWILSYEEIIESGERFFISKNFFQNWNRSHGKKINEVDIQNANLFFSQIIKRIKRIKADIEQNPNLKGSFRQFLLNKANNIWLKAIFLKKAVFIEAEKWGYQLSTNKKKLLLSQIKRLQTILYWPEISENPNEVNAIINSLDSLLEKNWDKLSTQDRKVFETFLDKFRKWEKTEHKSENKSEKIENPIFEKEIPLTQAKPILEKILKITGIDSIWKEVKISASASNFSASLWAKAIIMPEKVGSVTIKRLLELIDHEISTHAYRWYNKSKTVSESSPNYLEVEEWMAVFNEKLVSWNLEQTNIQPTIHHITTFIWEKYDFQDSLNLYRIYFLLIWENAEKANKLAYSRALRVKRFYPFDNTWANRKDVAYWRWLKDTFARANWENFEQFFKDFYFAKFDKNDMQLVDELKKDLWINENDIKYPLFFWQVLYKKLNWEKIFFNELRKDDPRPRLEQITHKQKRNLVEALNMMKSLE